MEIRIPGKPIAKARPRFARRGKFVTTYSAQETEEGKFYMLAREQVKEKMTGPLKVSIFLRFKRPKSHYGTGKNASKLKPGSPSAYEHTSKPDVDNCAKFIMDCLNELAWHDDTQIVSLRVTKMYWGYDETRIIIREEKAEL